MKLKLQNISLKYTIDLEDAVVTTCTEKLHTSKLGLELLGATPMTGVPQLNSLCGGLEH